METTTHTSPGPKKATQTLFETYPGFAIRSKKDGIIDAWNSRAEEVFGGNLAGQRVNTLLAHEGAETFMSGIRNAGSVKFRLHIDSVLYEIHAWWDAESQHAHFLGDTVSPLLQLPQSENVTDPQINYAEMVEAIHEGIALVDTDEKIEFCNRAFAQLLGQKSPEDLIGKSLLEFIPSDQHELIKRQAALWQQGASSRYEFEVDDLVLGRRTLMVTASPRLNQQDRQIGSYGIVRDVTEQRQALENLAMSEDRLQVIFDVVQTGIVIIDPETHAILDANPAAVQLIGVPHDRIVGQTCHEFICPAKEGQCPITDLHEDIDRSERVLLTAEEHEIPVLQTVSKITLNGREVLLDNFVDISDRVKAEQALRESNKRFQQIADNIDEIFFIMAPDCNTVIYTNPAYERIWGKSRDSLYASPRSWMAGIHPDDLEKVREYLERLVSVKTNDAEFPEFRVIRSDGTTRWVAGYGQPIRHDNGELENIVGVVLDITDRKLAAEQLAESECFLRSTLDALSAHIAILDDEGHIITVNQAWKEFACRNNGAPEAVCEGANYLAVCDNADGLNQEGARDFAAGIREVISGKGEFFYYEYPCHSPGEERYFLGRVTRFCRESGPRVVVAHENITERVIAEKSLKKSEKRYRELFDANPDGVLVTDRETRRFSYANAAICKMLGYSLEELHELSVDDIHPTQDLAEPHRGFESLVRGERQATIIRCLRKDGSTFLADIRAMHMVLSGRDCLVGIFKDTTELRQAEKERKRLEGELLHARKLESVGSLAAGIAHEINTPIQFVGDNTRFLKDSFESLLNLLDRREKLWQQVIAGGQPESLVETWREAAAEADLDYSKEEVPLAIVQTLDGIQRVTEIVRAMKDFAHQGQKERSPSDINSMLQSTLTVARNELKYVAEVVTDFDAHIPIIECYRNELNQVLLNLLVNAAHTIADVVGDGSQGKGTITVKTYREDDTVVVAITDTGTGIPEDARGRIFDPFFTTKDVGKGTGQGLSIAYQVVVEKHRGKLTFESEMGKGTTFFIHLPLHKEKEADSDGSNSAR